jgi:hypothetical protein
MVSFKAAQGLIVIEKATNVFLICHKQTNQQTNKHFCPKITSVTFGLSHLWQLSKPNHFDKQTNKQTYKSKIPDTQQNLISYIKCEKKLLKFFKDKQFF